jgi:predicted ATPase/DNA-binding CsgD family transcriptional regulator
VVAAPVPADHRGEGPVVAHHARARDNLPSETSSFVGRRAQLAEVRATLSRSRLVTLVGPGGVGKTRLALRVAREVRRSFAGGVWLVALGDVAEGRFVAPAVAAALGLVDETGRDPRAELIEYLADKQVLLLVDNCEHLLDPVAELVVELLRQAGELRVLATSRQPLRVGGEAVLPVPSLPVPDPTQPVADPADTDGEAMTLFVARATAASPAFTVTPGNRAEIARLCQRLDGLPLAIELAARRVPTLSVEEILARLDDRFRLLTTARQATPTRQRTLRATLDWTYGLCTATERLLWARLTVFAGSWDLEAAERVCADDGLPAEKVFDIQAELVDKSIVAIERHHGRARYRMLDTIRAYGHGVLSGSGELATLRRRHRDWYRRLAARVEREWFGPSQLEWHVRLRAEGTNLRQALEYSVDQPGDAGTALDMASSLWSHRLVGNPLSEGRDWLERGLRRAPAGGSRAKAFGVHAWLCLLQGDHAGAARSLAECEALARHIGDEPALVQAAHIRGLAMLYSGDYARAEELLHRALDWYRAHGPAGHIWITLYQLAMAAVFGDRPQATPLAEAALAMAARYGAHWCRSYSLWIVAVDRLRHGECRQAITALRRGLRIKQGTGDHFGIAQCLEVLAWASEAVDEPARAARLLGAAHAAWGMVGSSLPGQAHLTVPHDRCAAALAAALGGDGYTRAFEAGQALRPEQALREALDEQPSEARVAAPPDRRPAGDQLTRREHQVAGLAAQGLSNRQIAGTLLVSIRTAEAHIEHILAKLGFSSRAQIAAWVASRPDKAGADGVAPDGSGSPRPAAEQR